MDKIKKIFDYCFYSSPFPQPEYSVDDISINTFTKFIQIAIIGPSFSGKSTFYKQFLNHYCLLDKEDYGNKIRQSILDINKELGLDLWNPSVFLGNLSRSNKLTTYKWLEYFLDDLDDVMELSYKPTKKQILQFYSHLNQTESFTHVMKNVHISILDLFGFKHKPQQTSSLERQSFIKFGIDTYIIVLSNQMTIPELKTYLHFITHDNIKEHIKDVIINNFPGGGENNKMNEHKDLMKTTIYTIFEPQKVCVHYYDILNDDNEDIIQGILENIEDPLKINF